MKGIQVNFTDAEHSKIKEIKGDRTWRKAVLEEFGVESDEE